MPDFTPISQDEDTYSVQPASGGPPVTLPQSTVQSLGYNPAQSAAQVAQGGNYSPAPQAQEGVPPMLAAPPPSSTPAPGAGAPAVPFASVAGVQQYQNDMTALGEMQPHISTQPGWSPPKSLVKAQSDVEQAAEKNITDYVGMGQKRAAEISAFNQQAVAEQRNQAILDARAAESRRIETDYQIQRAKDAADDYNNQKVDPNKFWKEKGTGARVIGAIGVGLGAFGAALTHTPNFALEEINKAIDQNIDAQKEEIAKKGNRVSMENNILAQLRAKGLDDQQAESVARQVYSENAARQVGAIASKYDAPMVKQTAAQMINQLRGQAVQSKMQLAKDAAGKATIESAPTPVAGPNFETMNKAREFAMAKDGPLDNYNKDRRLLDGWNAARASGADAVAFANYIKANEGRLSETLAETLKQRPFWKKTLAGKLTEAAGGLDPETIDGIEKSLTQNVADSRARAKPILDGLRASGIDPALFIGASNEREKTDEIVDSHKGAPGAAK